MSGIVSILTPCYNGESYVSRYLDSVLGQTYPNIELIMVNDGSQDKTEEIVMSYKSKFKQRGIRFVYLFQENKGVGAAVNHGLKYFDGDYLTWLDPDDVLPEDSISRKVEFLNQNGRYGFVRTDGNIVMENNLSEIVGRFSDGITLHKEHIFDDLLLEKDIWIAPGCYMARRDAFLSVNPRREIYPSRAGQNWQMLLPLAYKYKCGYIDEPLFTYVVRSGSHSHSVCGFSEQLQRCDDHKDILEKTIDSINMSINDKLKYYAIIEEKYLRKKFKLSLAFREKDLIEYYFAELKQKNLAHLKDKIDYLRRFSVINLVYTGVNRMRKYAVRHVK